MSFNIPGLVGQDFAPGTPGYIKWQKQYALSTYEDAHDMKPGLIVVADNIEDIKFTLLYAKLHKKAIAVRSGGHQYCGASSTGNGNFLVDVSTTFRNPEDRTHSERGSQSFVRTSVSYNLGEFNAYLGSLNCFVPHGQCEFVYLGGHVQTGGYGQLGRSFGLLGDHVVSLEIIDHDANERTITKAEDPDLFFAWLGGSPGNMGILTHFTIEVHRDQDYVGSTGLRALHFYSEEKLTELVGYLAEMNDDPDKPRNYDLCISVLSPSFHITSWMGGLEKEVEDAYHEKFPETERGAIHIWPRMIIVYAQWVPFSKDDKVDKAWFEKFYSLFFHKIITEPMSKLTAKWIFHEHREFYEPYVKRTYVTKATNLSTNGWVQWVVDRMNSLMHFGNGQWLSAQLQCLGGKNSQLTRNAGNGTAYSWRDLSMCMTIDNFHKEAKKDEAEAWQKTNDKGAIGPNGLFSEEDMRVLWGSWGSFDLNANWSAYYDQETYERIQKARKLADPDGTFTPNTFAVKRAEQTWERREDPYPCPWRCFVKLRILFLSIFRRLTPCTSPF
ncbi:hypothetical protein BKA70DRAFT_1115034 [Coprinopsis sp. MPI-PUGE-AT-0042]|nr:hypothetical protein BKA70DRAFT_1115034 [Coprinopsis sp. MPI-PUGE-AT-0042]